MAFGFSRDAVPSKTNSINPGGGRLWLWDVPSPWFPLAPGRALCSAPAGCGSSVSARVWRGDQGWLARVVPTVGAAGTAQTAFWGVSHPSMCCALGGMS